MPAGATLNPSTLRPQGWPQRGALAPWAHTHSVKSRPSSLQLPPSREETRPGRDRRAPSSHQVPSGTSSNDLGPFTSSQRHTEHRKTAPPTPPPPGAALRRHLPTLTCPRGSSHLTWHLSVSTRVARSPLARLSSPGVPPTPLIAPCGFPVPMSSKALMASSSSSKTQPAPVHRPPSLG